MGPEQAASPLAQFPIIPYLLIFAIFYFLVIKPNKDKQKDQKQMWEGLKKNDDIVTAGGIHGRIVNTKEKTVIIRVDDNVRFEIDREAVTSVKKNT